MDRGPAGPSGGSAAAAAASLGEAALGTDTGNSIRGPSAHQALVGIRSTMGLTSRDGVAPLNLASDIAGPMARTVADAVAIFQVVAGEDSADTVTARSRGHRAESYAAALNADGLRGARIGVLHQAYDRESTDPEVVGVLRRRWTTCVVAAPSSSIQWPCRISTRSYGRQAAATSSSSTSMIGSLDRALARPCIR